MELFNALHLAQTAAPQPAQVGPISPMADCRVIAIDLSSTLHANLFLVTVSLAGKCGQGCGGPANRDCYNKWAKLEGSL